MDGDWKYNLCALDNSLIDLNNIYLMNLILMTNIVVCQLCPTCYSLHLIHTLASCLTP